MLVLQDHVWTRVTKNRHLDITTWYYMDEFHVLLADDRTSGYSVDFWKRFRKTLKIVYSNPEKLSLSLE